MHWVDFAWVELVGDGVLGTGMGWVLAWVGYWHGLGTGMSWVLAWVGYWHGLGTGMG